MLLFCVSDVTFTTHEFTALFRAGQHLPAGGTSTPLHPVKIKI